MKVMRLIAGLGLFRDVWIALGAVALVCFAVGALGIREQSIRIGGLTLQLLGVLTVVVGISKTRQIFGRPSFLDALRERVRLFRSYLTLGAAAELTGTGGLSIGGSARAYQRNTPPAGATVTQRLDSLEKNIDYVHERIDTALGELDEARRVLTAELRGEKAERCASDERIAARLQDLGVGGLTLSGIGALWLFVGIIMSTVPAEIAAVLGR